MPTKIGGFDSGPGSVSTGRTVKRTGDAGQSSASGSAGASSGDSHITDSARKLAELEQVVQALPAVDPGDIVGPRVCARFEMVVIGIRAEQPE